MFGERRDRSREPQLEWRRNVIRYDSECTIDAAMLPANVGAKPACSEYLVTEIEVTSFFEYAALLVGEDFHEHRFCLFRRKGLFAVDGYQLSVHAKENRYSRRNVDV